jgi:uncharacterized protein YpmB
MILAVLIVVVVVYLFYLYLNWTQDFNQGRNIARAIIQKENDPDMRTTLIDIMDNELNPPYVVPGWITDAYKMVRHWTMYTLINWGLM